MKISLIYGKRVESTAGKTGYVISVNGNGDRLECLICADENENEFAVDIKNIVSIGEKIVFEDRESAIKASKPIRLGSAGFDEQGIYLGNLEDYTFSKCKLLKAKIGKKNYPAEGVINGDAVVVKGLKALKYDVVKDGKVLIKKGTLITENVLNAAEEQGEYVQTRMKLI